MKIIGLHVYGYGKLENLEISNFSSNIQVIYGKNEAGKSTLMSFIHSILFGFPTKLQQEQRYIPKRGMKYGGKLIVLTEEHGTIIIERIPGKSTGDVTIYLPNGMTEGEGFLSKLVNGMDKKFFQSIYSFDIHGLQGVQHLKSEDLGRFLFSSGVIGTDALMSLQQKLTKEKEALFKPNGKKPLLNAELIDLKEDHSQLMRWQEKNNSYQFLLEQQLNLEKKLTENEFQKNSYQVQIRDSERFQSIQPILSEYELLAIQINQLPAFEPFPEDGLHKLDQLQAQLKPYEAQLSALTTQRNEWQKGHAAINLDSEFLTYETTIIGLSSKKGMFEEKQYRLQAAKDSHQQLKDEVQKQKELLRIEIKEDEILSFDTSISAKEMFSTVVSEVERSKQRKEFLDENFNRAKDAIENCEAIINELEKQVLPESERNTLEEFIELEKEKSEIEKEKRFLNDEMSRIDKKMDSLTKQVKGRKRKINILFGIIGIALLSAAVYAIVIAEWLFGILSIFLMLLLLPIAKLIGSQAETNFIQELKKDKLHLLKRLASLDEQLSSVKGTNNHDATVSLMKDQQIRQRLEVEKASYKQYEQLYEKVLVSYEEWESSSFEVNEKSKVLKKKYKLPLDISNELLLDAYQLLEGLKGKIQQKERNGIEIQMLEDEVKQYQNKVQNICSHLKIVIDDPFLAIDTVVSRLLEEKHKQEQVLQFERKIEEVSERITHLELEVEHLRKECILLWNQAEVATEDEFRAKGHASDHAKDIKKKMSILRAQLDRYGEIVEKCQVHQNYQMMIEEGTTRLEQLALQEKECQLQLSEIKLRIEELEEGGTYSELLHSFEGKKSIAREYAKQWAVYAVAKDLLTGSVEKYRKERLPMVLNQAEKYYHLLTDGKYVRIFPANEDDGFLVEGKNGVRYKPNELSQATAEQLYIALRFALAGTMHPNQKYPFIIDDSFVNFDSLRLDQTIQLLEEVSKDHQVLLFTCHQHMVDKFQSVEPYFLT
nr:AAA family ATPase [Fredinandcohnia sp. SECRCQ15]